jgi:hypothetical protein
VTGTKLFVVDGHTAGLLLVIARAPDGPALFAVEGAAPGVTRAKLDSLDLTRGLASVTLDGASAARIDTGAGFAAWLSRTPPRSAFRSTAASATPGNTTPIFTCGGRSRRSSSSGRPPPAAPGWPS